MSNKPISIGGKVFKAQPDGSYIVNRRLLRGQDLRKLPPNTEVCVHPASVRASSAVVIMTITGPTPGGFNVRFVTLRNPGAWAHSLSYSKYMDAVRELMIQATSTGIQFEHSVEDEEVIAHFWSVTRPEYTIDDLEAALDSEVDNILSPLDQFTAQLDKQVKQLFNV